LSSTLLLKGNLEEELEKCEARLPTSKMEKYKPTGGFNKAYLNRLELIRRIEEAKGAHRRGSLGEDQESILL